MYNKLQPFELFELFFDQQLLDMTVKYSNMYAFTKNQDLQITVDKLKCFLGILLLSGYNEVSRRRMYWERSPDAHNELVANAMRRNLLSKYFRFYIFAITTILMNMTNFRKSDHLFQC